MKWKLPEVFKVSKIKKGFRQRHDGEPQIFELAKHANDRTLSIAEFAKCCDCGLVHLHTFNVMRVRRKKKTKWYLIKRAYRV